MRRVNEMRLMVPREVIQDLLNNHGAPYRVIAEQAGTNITALSRLVNGQRYDVPRDTASNLERVLNVAPGSLFAEIRTSVTLLPVSEAAA